jgi:hypothetical protein
VTTGSAKIYLGLTEEKPNVFRAESDVSGAPLPDADLQRPYKVEARVVAGITDMTGYANIGVAFEASSDVAYTPDVPPTLLGGILRDGTWYTAANVAGETLNARLTSDAFNALSDAVPTGAPSGVLAKLMWLVQRSLRKRKRPSSTIKVKKADGTTATTQPITSDGTNETVGSPA